MGRAIFAAGCFWGVQYYFDQVPGVISSRVGYTGGHTEHPTYEDVCTHKTGHAEAIEIRFDDAQVSYETLLRQFFRMHDPTQLNRQGPDIGDNYRSAIFYTNEQQRLASEAVMQQIQIELKTPVVTQIVSEAIFYEAEAYHQKFTQRTGRGACHIAYKSIS